MTRVVALLSGGIDSAVAAAKAREAFPGCDLYAISFDYGQKHREELHAARAVADNLSVQEHRIAQVALGAFPLTGAGALEAGRSADEIRAASGAPAAYVPGRNLVFLALAASWAEALGAEAVVIGANADDHAGFVDCRPDFFRAVEAVWRTTLGDKAPRIYAPLLGLQKPEIVAEGYRLRVDIGVTWSCYSPRVPGVPCGACDACALRRDAIRRASVPARSLPT